MSADRNLTERDYELLSAYLDGELTDSDRLALEIRLDAEPELRQELNSLRQTVRLIRQLPAMKAPRDFTLQRPADAEAAAGQTAAQPRPLPLVLRPAFSALSAAAAVLLLAIGAYWLGQVGTPRSLLQAPAAEVVSVPLATSTPFSSTEATSALPTAAMLREESQRDEEQNTDEASLSAGTGGLAAPPAENDTLSLFAAEATPEAGDGAASAAISIDAAEPADAATMAAPAQTAVGDAQGQIQEAAGAPGARELQVTTTASPTIMPSPAPAAERAPISTEFRLDSPDTVGLAAVGAGVLLLFVAIVTTLLRRRAT